MDREQLQEKIEEQLTEAWLDGIQGPATTEKIMLLIDEYTTPDMEGMWTDHMRQVILSPGENINFLKMRGGWTDQLLEEELGLFLDREYPKQDADENRVRRHFFNYIKKRKPNEKKQSRYDKFANGHQSEFGGEDGPPQG